MVPKTVIVQLASFNRVIHVPTTGKENEQEVLVKLVWEVYVKQIDSITFQIKDKQWGEGIFSKLQCRIELFSKLLWRSLR